MCVCVCVTNNMNVIDSFEADDLLSTEYLPDYCASPAFVVEEQRRSRASRRAEAGGVFSERSDQENRSSCVTVVCRLASAGQQPLAALVSSPPHSSPVLRLCDDLSQVTLFPASP